MEKGLQVDNEEMPMLPSFFPLREIRQKEGHVMVIDAGGTNFRAAVVSFREGKGKLEFVKKAKMPGVDYAVSWDEFICFTADQIEPFLDVVGNIGFCFSYTALQLPDGDAQVVSIDKEVMISGAEGKLVGRSLADELVRRGVKVPRITVLNDTVAVLLGACAGIDTDVYGGFVAQVSGTGTNTCMQVRGDQIKKLPADLRRDMIVNCESGAFRHAPANSIDTLIDERSSNKGQYLLEKITAGAYLGEICTEAIREAFTEKLISRKAMEYAEHNPLQSAAEADRWTQVSGTEEIPGTEEDRTVIREICRSVFIRSAKYMAAVLTANMLTLNYKGEKPICIVAEGSLAEKSEIYRTTLSEELKKCAGDRFGLKYTYRICNNSTLTGTAVAAL